MVFISTYGKILYQTKFCFHFIFEKWCTYLLKWFKLSLLGMLWSYNFSSQTLVLLLYYTRVQITAILLWDSTIVPIICNIEQEVYVHQHLETYLYSKKPYSCCHAGLFKVYIRMRVSFFEVPSLFYLVNEEIQCGKIQTMYNM